MSAPVRVMIVDDSVVIRRLLSNLIDQDPDLEVAGIAQNGAVALERLETLNPDVITLDIEMPELDGLEALKEIRKTHPTLPVIMFSTLTGRGAEATLNALAYGASDYVTKPANVGSVSEGMERVRDELVPKIKALCKVVHASAPPQSDPTPAAQTPAAASVGVSTPPPAPRKAPPIVLGPPTGRIDLVAIGSSTGGPNALTDVLGTLPGNLAVPVVITQHMPAVFTRYLAERLDGTCDLHVVEGQPGMLLEAGTVYIAPGDYHMTFNKLAAGYEIVTNQEPPENYCRPAVDVMMRSVCEHFGGNVLGVMLTGMGSDGCNGFIGLKGLGGHIIAQDEASSVVWGMPGAVAHAGITDQILPLSQIGPEIATQVASKHLATAGSRP